MLVSAFDNFLAAKYPGYPAVFSSLLLNWAGYTAGNYHAFLVEIPTRYFENIYGCASKSIVSI